MFACTKQKIAYNSEVYISIQNSWSRYGTCCMSPFWRLEEMVPRLSENLYTLLQHKSIPVSEQDLYLYCGLLKKPG